jgi:hypothetical protein
MHCPNCGAPRPEEAAFCASCGAAFEGPTRSTQQDLARAAITVQNVNLLTLLGGVVGFVVGGYIGWIYGGDLRLLLVLVLPFVGLFLGSRLTLILMAR